jgi:negative regulator of replication initiation
MLTKKLSPKKTPRKYVINISKEVKDYLDNHAQGMSVSADSVLRRLFKMKQKKN